MSMQEEIVKLQNIKLKGNTGMCKGKGKGGKKK